MSIPQISGVFPVSDQQHVFKESSTALLSITFILFLGFTVAKIMANRRTQYGADKQQEVPKILKNFIRVVEFDMAPSLVIYFFMIGLGEFFIFAAVFAYFMLITSALLVVAYQKNAYKLVFVLRLLIVFFTISAFFNIFIDNMVFKDNYPNILSSLANGDWRKPDSQSSDTIPTDDMTNSTNNNSTLRF